MANFERKGLLAIPTQFRKVPGIRWVFWQKAGKAVKRAHNLRYATASLTLPAPKRGRSNAYVFSEAFLTISNTNACLTGETCRESRIG